MRSVPAQHGVVALVQERIDPKNRKATLAVALFLLSAESWILEAKKSRNKQAKDILSHNRKKTPVRRKFGLQEELAEKCDLHPTYIGSVERGERNISLENIIQIAKALRCNGSDLLIDL